MTVFDDVNEWNRKAGNTPAAPGTIAYWAKIEDQSKRIHEEFKELFEAIQARDIKACLDGCIDLEVTATGLAGLLGLNGSYNDAAKLVQENNDLKITLDKSKAENWKIYWEDNGVDCYVKETSIDDLTWYCVRRTEDNKILKYGNFPEVNLEPFVPTELGVDRFLVAEAVTEETEAILEEDSELGFLLASSIEDASGAFQQALDQIGGIGIMRVQNGGFVGLDSITKEEVS